MPKSKKTNKPLTRRPLSKRKPVEQKEDNTLLGNFIEALLADEHPNPKSYLMRYCGPDIESLKLELNLATFLSIHSNAISQKLHKLKNSSGDQKTEG